MFFYSLVSLKIFNNCLKSKNVKLMNEISKIVLVIHLDELRFMMRRPINAWRQSILPQRRWSSSN